MSDLQWKIHDGELWVRNPPNMVSEWSRAGSFGAARILQSAILATQEKCAQVAANYEGDTLEGKYQQRLSIASAIRALNTETGE